MSTTVADAVPPPAAFLPSEEEDKLIDQRLEAVDRAEGRKASKRKWGGRVGWALFYVAVAANLGQSFVTASLFPLKERVHNYTVLRDDSTAQVYRTTWDLPPNKTEELIQATAVRYTRACTEWSWVHARYDYNFCLALSQADRKDEHARRMDRETNPQAPENVYGQDGFVRVGSTSVSRIGPNTVRVYYTELAVERRGAPPRVRRMEAVHDYVPVAELPVDLKLMEPIADIQFIRSEFRVDTSPIALNPELAPAQNEQAPGGRR